MQDKTYFEKVQSLVGDERTTILRKLYLIYINDYCDVKEFANYLGLESWDDGDLQLTREFIDEIRRA